MDVGQTDKLMDRHMDIQCETLMWKAMKSALNIHSYR